jgi:hypothetical protein
MDADPPPYTALPIPNDVRDNSQQAYTFPTQFSIGSLKTDSPLVNTAHLKGHLALLHAFAGLKTHVEGLNETNTQVRMPAEVEMRWAWFVGLAVER